MTTRKLTKAQRRYLQGIKDGNNVFRPRALGGGFGDLKILLALNNMGLADFSALYPVITDAGRAALKDRAK